MALKKDEKNSHLFLPSIERHVNLSEIEIMAINEVVEYIVKRGFYDIIRIRRDEKGRCYINKNGKILIHVDYPMNEKVNINSLKEGIELSRVLAMFHNAAEGFKGLPGIKLKVSWGKKIEKFKKMTGNLEKYMDKIIDCQNLTPFERETLEYLNEFHKRARYATEVLRDEESLMRLEESMQKREVCLNSLSQNTFKYYEGRNIIDNIFDIDYNMVEEDIALLIKRVIEYSGNNNVLYEILESYSKVRYLSPYSREIVKALVVFPYNSIKTIEKYMRDNNENLIDKFKAYVKKENRIKL